jgi:uncharacterized lipoprotein YbaY
MRTTIILATVVALLACSGSDSNQPAPSNTSVSPPAAALHAGSCGSARTRIAPK